MATARAARTDDYEAFARLFAELVVPDPTPTRDVYDAQIRPHAIVLEDGEVIAYAYFVVFGDVTHVKNVVVDRAHRGKKLGRALLDEVARRARAGGSTRWYLNVKPDNAAAIRLYEGAGLRTVLASSALEIAWSDVARLPARSAIAETPRPEDDATIESTFGLAAGHVPSLRASDRVLVALRDGGALVGFAAFDPSFPGAAPLRLARPDLARAMLEALRPHARPEHASVRLFVEGDPRLVEALRQCGARVVLEALRMEGALQSPSAPLESERDLNEKRTREEERLNTQRFPRI